MDGTTRAARWTSGPATRTIDLGSRPLLASTTADSVLSLKDTTMGRPGGPPLAVSRAPSLSTTGTDDD